MENVQVENFTKPGRGFLGLPLRAQRVTTLTSDGKTVEFYVEGELVERRVEAQEVKS